MKITIIIPSRGRHFSLREVVDGMRARESGNHQVTYVVGCDIDDPQTIAITHMMRLTNPRLATRLFKRQASLGALVNIMAEEYPADVYCSLCDDIEILSHGWDEAIHWSWKIEPKGVWWWGCETSATFAIISEKWREAAGYIFTDYFPFWFDDMWLLELWKLATGKGLQLIPALLKDRAPGTHRMRDLQFWCDFFMGRQQERLLEATRIAGLLGWQLVSDPAKHQLRPNGTFSAAETEAWQGEKSPPTPEYIAARQRAEMILSIAA